MALVDSQATLSELSLLIAQYETDYLRAVLARTGGNISRAADLAGVNRRFIQRAAKLYGLSKTDDDLK